MNARPQPTGARHGASRKAADGYGTREVAELIGFSRDQVRRFARRGIVHPSRGVRAEYRFSFQDVALMRAARRLVDAKVPMRRVFEALDRLQRRENVPPSLSAVRIAAEGSTVVVHDAHTVWEALSGQCRLQLPGAGSARPSAAKPRGRAPGHVGRGRRSATVVEINTLSSDDWYNLGLDLEEVEPGRAPEAYRRSIALDPANADAHVNLGRLYQIAGDLKRAKRHYRRALESAPAHELACYNMGTVFDELEESDIALDYYRRAVSIPDAHYNLARIFGLRGDELSSLRHLKRYRQLGGT